jgi:hypothetical protein
MSIMIGPVPDDVGPAVALGEAEGRGEAVRVGSSTGFETEGRGLDATPGSAFPLRTCWMAKLTRTTSTTTREANAMTPILPTCATPGASHS